MSGIQEWRNEWQAMVGWLNKQPDGAVCPFRFPDVVQVVGDLDLEAITTRITSGAPPEFPSTEPALKNVDDTLLGALQHALYSDPNDARVAAWAEKLLHICEIRRLELRQRSRQGDETVEDGRRKIFWLCLFFLEHFQAHGDPRYVNLVLKILDQSWLRGELPRRAWARASAAAAWQDVLVVLVHALLAHALHIIGQDDWQTEVRFSSSECVEQHPQVPMKAVFESADAPGVIVFSPNPYSLYTLAVLQLLTIHGVWVQGIAVRRLFNRKRFFHEFKRDGVRLLRKIWIKLVLRKKAYRPRAYQTLPQLLTQLGVTRKHVAAWAKDHGVPVWQCDTLNDDNVLEALKANQPKTVVFTGGGLIREPVLEASGAGVINTHLGLLPPYRGMDVVEWPILENRPHQVGLTVHFMAKGVDEGDILVMHRTPHAHTEDILQLRERMEVLSPQASVSATLRFLQGELQARSQVLADGKQYFIIHPCLYDLALKRYQRFRDGGAE